MKLSRSLFLSLAVPAALSLAACGGSSNTIANVTGSQAFIRFVHGAPAAAGAANAVDVYYTSSGTTASSTPLLSNVSYGSITDFGGQSPVAATIVLKSAGTQTAVGGCTIPQLSNNAKYSIVFVNSGNAATAVTCALFQDFDYTAPGQFRVHHASPAAAAAGLGTVSFGLTNGQTPFPATFTVAGTANFPGTTLSAPTAGYASTGPNSGIAAGTPVGFVIGASGNAGTTANTVAGINASQLVVPPYTAGATPPASANAANTLPGGGFNDASIFAIDCSAGTTPEGSTCANGVGLIGSFDTK